MPIRPLAPECAGTGRPHGLRSVSSAAPAAADRRPRWLAALVIVLTAALAGRAAAAELQPFQVSYAWVWHGAPVAVSTIELTHRQGDIWAYTSSTKPRGIGRLYPMRPHLQSIMRINAQGVQPLHFVATGSGRNHDADVDFDWDSGHITGLYEGAHVDLPIQPGVQDDLSVQIALLVQLLGGGTPDKALEINKDAVREYDYRREGEQMLNTALGPIDTIVYEIHHAGSPRTTRFWCAPSKGFIPMQVQQRRLDRVEWTLRIRSLAIH
ncbi:MAG TPA: DUF3108 domain-containing protein [Steroidobacteraceae bacterium]|jgi:hypothetical protein|nr:DUF3108 domain-containing protein [Steroidobacteraceae bacterium]